MDRGSADMHSATRSPPPRLSSTSLPPLPPPPPHPSPRSPGQENGPCLVDKDGQSTTFNPYSWSSNATVIWIDQPAQVGFSVGSDIATNEDEVGADMLAFTQALFAARPDLVANPFYVFGESYGGHYVPAVS
jgi:cathepsin A (carboxypeptidase C)